MMTQTNTSQQNSIEDSDEKHPEAIKYEQEMEKFEEEFEKFKEELEEEAKKQSLMDIEFTIQSGKLLCFFQ